MKNPKILGTIGFLALAMASTAVAQMGMMRGPQPRGLFNPIVGFGAQYEIQTDKGTKMVMEINVVGKESVGGKDGYWFETTMSNPQMGDIVMKVLTVPDGATTSTTRMIMQMGNRPPMEMPVQMNRMNNQKQPVDIRSEAEDVGSESVTTPAGTFTCEHYRMKDGSGDTWLSEKVSPYGLVKHQGKDSTMVLTKVVTDAKDKITGTPQPFNPMMMGMGGPPQQ
ncbi:MAG: hypothetical protein ACRD4C_12305 [Candidatus Acidiferrales bacterium]